MENSEWNCVLNEKDLIEGKMKLVRVQGTPVALIKQQGQFFAIDNRCPHLGCGLSGGSLDGFWVVCPCHDWRFDLETGLCEEGPGFELVMYKLKIEAGKIWIRIEE